MLYLNAENIQLNAGYPIAARCVHDIKPSLVKAGENVRFVVDRDIIVDNKILIKEGSAIIGNVAEANSNGYVGQGGELQILFKNTTSVDNQTILLTGSVNRKGKNSTAESVTLGLVCCPIAFLGKGNEAVIQVGQIIEVYIANDIKIKVE
jgi:SUMO ligase MMS21 Smc5/6 complex component